MMRKVLSVAREQKPIHLAAGLFLSALLSACQPTAGVESNLAFAPPERILQVRAIDRSMLRPSAMLSDGTNIPMLPNGDNTWTGTVFVQPENTYTVSVDWIETLPEGELILAQWSDRIDVNADGAEINISNDLYNFNHDFDGDQVINIVEREQDTNPFVHNDLNNEGGSDDSGASSGGVADAGMTSNGNDDFGATTGDGVNTETMPDAGLTSGQTTDSGATDADDIGVTTTGNSDAGSSDEGTTSGGASAGTADSGSTDGTSGGATSSGDSAGSTDSADITDEEFPAPATVVIPRIAPSTAPLIDGLNVTFNALDNLTGEWDDAVQFDDFGERLWINNLMIDQGADAEDGANLRQWAAMHDGINLYVLVLSDDIGQRHSDSVNHWEDDSLELFIDGDNSKLTEWGDADDFQMHIPLLKQFDTAANNEISGRVSSGPGSEFLPIEFFTGPGVGPDGIRITRWELDVYEVAIPLTAAGITIGEPFGFELQLNDDDDGGARDSKWGWFHPSHTGDGLRDETFRNPSIMGTVVLQQ